MFLHLNVQKNNFLKRKLELMRNGEPNSKATNQLEKQSSHSCAGLKKIIWIHFVACKYIILIIKIKFNIFIISALMEKSIILHDFDYC